MTTENRDTSAAPLEHDTAGFDAAVETFGSLLDAEGAPDTGRNDPEVDAEADEAEALEADTEGDASEDADTDADEGEEPDADGEADEEPKEEAADDVEGADAKPADPKAKVTVEIDGKSEELTVEELTKGYLRQSDYTRKTQEVAEARKATDGELDAVRTERAQYAQLLPILAAQVDQAGAEYAKLDWDALKRDDPTAFAVKRLEFQELTEKRRAIHEEQVRLNAATTQEQRKAFTEAVQAEAAKLLEAIPAWKDAKIAARDKAAIREYGAKIGFSKEELDMASDHRAIVTLRKAMKWDALQAKRASAKPATPAPGPAPLKPGTSNKPPRQAVDRSNALKRLARTGSVDDAAKAFEHLI